MSFDRLYCTPLPIQKRIPIWYGATATEALAHRIAELGDGWFPLGPLPIVTIRAGRELIASACRKIGRDPQEISIRYGLKLLRGTDGSPDWLKTLEVIPQLTAESVSTFAVVLGPGLRTLDEVRTYLETLTRAWPY